MLKWFEQINLFYLFLVLLAVHLMLYISLGTDSWFITSVLAAGVETIAVGILRVVIRKRQKT
ncbi:hypothetical protein [Marinicrinis lubricantis]|uniref:Uncharacterized protein n=1 Tax=Marinicrinis lubricantis TaxID=2086470 RepID=A0ABW1IVL2_9BACL